MSTKAGQLHPVVAVVPRPAHDHLSIWSSPRSRGFGGFGGVGQQGAGVIRSTASITPEQTQHVLDLVADDLHATVR